MKIKIVKRNEKYLERYDYRNFLRIEINDKKEFEVMDGEPEDSNLSRDFNDCLKIIDLMKMAFNAGKNGEKFELEKGRDEY